LDRDLTAIGVGTVCSGLLGGLPMIAEIVRSSANVNNGARTRWANFFHGLCMLLFVVFAPGLIHRIPLASLAAILCLVGFRLASPREFRKTWAVGPDQMLIFLTTIGMTLATDLLVGIFSGVAAKLILHLVRGVGPKQLLNCQCEIHEQPEGVQVQLGGALTFTQILQLRSRLAHLPTGKCVTLDLSRTHFVDHSCMEYLEQFEHDYTRTGGSIHLVGLEAHQSASAHPLACRRRRA
jgi:MFS superfamily sulfate permease-like transporter